MGSWRRSLGDRADGAGREALWHRLVARREWTTLLLVRDPEPASGATSDPIPVPTGTRILTASGTGTGNGSDSGTARLDQVLFDNWSGRREQLLVRIAPRTAVRASLATVLPALPLCTAYAVQLELTSIGPGDRAWLLDHFTVHLVRQPGVVAVPAASRQDLDRLGAGPGFADGDAVLASEILAGAL